MKTKALISLVVLLFLSIIGKSQNNAPVAVLENDYSWPQCKPVFIDGSNSYDDNSDKIYYEWTYSADLFNETYFFDEYFILITKRFEKDTAVEVYLKVHDGELYSEYDTLKITLTAAPYVAPVADAGEYKYKTPPNTKIILSGDNSSGGCYEELTYKWSSPDGIKLYNSNESDCYFLTPTSLEEETYPFILKVNDGIFSSEPDTVFVTVQSSFPQVWFWKNNITVTECEEVSIYPSFYPSNLNRNTLDFFWKIPEGLDFIDSAKHGFTFIAPAVKNVKKYTFSLYVYDGVHYSDTEEITITVENSPINKAPEIDFMDMKTEYFECDKVNITTYFPESTYGEIEYHWTIYPDVYPILHNHNSSGISFNLPKINANQNFNISVTASNCEYTSAPIFTSILSKNTINEPPNTTIYIPEKAYLGDTVYLRNNYSDPNCDEVISTKWTAPSGLFIKYTNNNLPFVVIPTNYPPQKYLFTCTVSDTWSISEPDSAFITIRSKEEQAIDYLQEVYHKLSSSKLFGLQYQNISYSYNPYLIAENSSLNYYNINKYSSYNNSLYHGLYSTINASFLAIELIDELSIDASLKTKLFAEAKFINALCNFYLTTIYKNPPLLSEGIQTKYSFYYPYTDFYHSAPTEFYNQIETTLIEVINTLPDSREEGNEFRPTKGAAQALLGKAYLYQEKWQKAKDQFEAVINSNNYSLVQPLDTDKQDYFAAFNSNFTYVDDTVKTNIYPSEFNSESIFEINYTRETGCWNCNNSNYIYKYFSQINGSYLNIAPKNEYVDIFEKAPINHPSGYEYDPRRFVTFFSKGDTVINYPIDNPQIFNAFPKEYGEDFAIKKFYWPSNPDDYRGINSPNNWRLIRYADILLMYAEAEYHLNGSTTEALAAINQVRGRVGMPPITEVTPEAIMHERKVELAAEGHLFWDMLRWLKLDEPWVTADDFKTGFIPEQNMYLPIPEHKTSTGESVSLSVDEYEPIKKLTKGKITTFPNPASDYINIKSDVALNEIYLFNSLGQKVASRKAENSFSTQLDIYHLPTGFYILSVQDIYGEVSNSIVIKK